MQVRAVSLLVVALAVQDGGGFAAGERAYAEGRFADAAAAFGAECAARGDAAPAELWFDLGQAAFAAGDLAASERALLRAAALAAAGSETARHCAFAQGSIHWQRGEAAVALARQVEAEPFAFDAAQKQIEAALQQWQRAAAGERDWPAARRNAERALRRLGELRAERQRAEDARRKKAGAQERPQLVPPGGGQDQDKQGGGGNVTDTQDNPLAPLRTELSDAQVEDLFGRLRQKEQRQRELRRAEQERARTPGARDW